LSVCLALGMMFREMARLAADAGQIALDLGARPATVGKTPARENGRPTHLSTNLGIAPAAVRFSEAAPMVIPETL
jgi:hypothetical protein